MTTIDTNVLVYASVPVMAQHARASGATSAARQRGAVAVPVRCLREFLVVMSRPQAWAPQPDLGQALRLVREFQATKTVMMEGPRTWDTFFHLVERFQVRGKLVHDANIVANMLAHDEDRLLTFNGGDFRRVAPLIEVVEP